MGVSDNGKLSSLDALRGLLSLVVVAAHSWQIIYLPLGNRSVVAAHVFGLSARVAVLCFFCLSGYVIALSLHANRRRHGVFKPADYGLARAFRIAPPLLAVMSLTFALEFVLVLAGFNFVRTPGAARVNFATDLPGQLQALASLCTSGELTGRWLNGPLWSLTFELRLYVVSGLIATIAWSPHWPRLALAVLLLGWYLVRIGLVPSAGPWLDLQATCFLAFGFGASAYLLREARTGVVLGVMAMGMTVAGLIAAKPNMPPLLDNLDSEPWLAVQACLAIALAAAVLLAGRVTARDSVLSRSGRYSYSLYIGHFPLLLFFFFVLEHKLPVALSPDWAMSTAIAAMLATWLMLASLGRWLERPSAQRAFFEHMLERPQAN